MSEPLPSAATALRIDIEERADSMSSAAQMALDGLAECSAPADAKQDLQRVQESARAIYRMVHKELVARHFRTLEIPAAEELHRIRHDLRGLLQNILMRCELLTEEETLSATVRDEVAGIRRNARECVEAVNANRDAIVREDVTPHLLPDTPPDETVDLVRPAQAPIAAARILIADDSVQSRELLSRFLVRLGHSVACAATGREALECAQAEEFDLILLDLIMPELNGFEVLEALRRLGILHHTPVILISGMDTEGNAIHGIELGAEDFLPRPVNLKVLRARVNSSLERQRLRERELAQYFTPQLARHLLRHPEVLATGRSTVVSVLFCDIVGFSSVSERLGPQETIRWIGAVLGAMSGCVMAEDGVLVDYSGDQIMALWGAPTDQPDHADRACRCAAAMMAVLPALDADWQGVVGQSTKVTIGINSGEAFVGNIGTAQKFKYGALGNTVNLASRVQSAAKYVRAPVMFTGSSRQCLLQSVPSRRLGKVRVNNIEETVDLYELYDARSPGMAALAPAYETALTSFEQQALHSASALLGDLLVKYPQDGPSLLLMSRTVQEMLRNDAGPFDPVWTLPGK